MRLQCATASSCVLSPGELTCAYPVVSEAPACNYFGIMYVDCSRNTYNPGTLCVDLPSPTSSVTPTVTPTSTISAGASPSQSPSVTASTSNTASNTPSISVTGSISPSATRSGSPTATLVPKPAWLASLFGPDYGLTINPGNIQYTYRPFWNLFQGAVSIGSRYKGFETVPDASCGSGARYTRQTFGNGDFSSTCTATAGQLRESAVTFTCDPNATAVPRLTSVLEAPTCSYSFTFTVPCDGNPDFPGTLCIEATPSATASITASSSATLSAGAQPSSTASPSYSMTATRTMTQSPFSMLPVRARITIGANYLNFYELLVVSTTGRVLSATAAGAVATMSSTYDVWYPTLAADLCMQPIETQGGCNYAHRQVGLIMIYFLCVRLCRCCSNLNYMWFPLPFLCLFCSNLATQSWYDVLFPGALPTDVAWVYFFNRVTTGCGAGACV